MTRANYQIEHWTTAQSEHNYQTGIPFTVNVNDRAATKRAIVKSIKGRSVRYVERAEWRLPSSISRQKEGDWSYTMIAIHHAGRNFRCGAGVKQMQQVEHLHIDKKHWSDIGYHYGIDCSGVIYEGVDIRAKGSNLESFNGGVIGIVLLENMSEPEDGKGFTAIGLQLAKDFGLGGQVLITGAQQSTLKELIEVLREYFVITVLGGHIEFPFQVNNEGKLCPGRHGLALVKELREWSGLQKPK